MKNIYSVITGTGSYIPPRCIKNEHFLSSKFYDSSGNILRKSNQEIIEKFEAITEIKERRIIADDLVTSDIASYAAIEALKAAEVDKEDLDYIILAHNFGDVKHDDKLPSIVPSLAARVKQQLGIVSPDVVAYDLIFGCPGWLEALIQANYYIKSGDAKKILVIGADVLSRMSDPHDRDGMLYADGAGAVILEAKESDIPIGIIGHKTRSDTLLHAQLLYMGKSYNINSGNNIYLKMYGRKLYRYAIEYVPLAIIECLKKNDIHLSQIKKILMHQANGKMNAAILERLYDHAETPQGIMPMTVGWLGNSSVATVPTLLDLILKDKLEPHQINQGDNIVFASVGAGMNINALVYKR